MGDLDIDTNRNTTPDQSSIYHSFLPRKLRLIGHKLDRKRCLVELGQRQTLGVGDRGLPTIG